MLRGNLYIHNLQFKFTQRSYILANKHFQNFEKTKTKPRYKRRKCCLILQEITLHLCMPYTEVLFCLFTPFSCSVCETLKDALT